MPQQTDKRARTKQANLRIALHHLRYAVLLMRTAADFVASTEDRAEILKQVVTLKPAHDWLSKET